MNARYSVRSIQLSIALLSIICLSGTEITAQALDEDINNNRKFRTQGNIGSRGKFTRDFGNSLPLPPPKTEGSYFLFEHFLPTQIVFVNGDTLESESKFHVEMQSLALRDDKGEYGLPTAFVDRFEWTDGSKQRAFTNSLNLPNNHLLAQGFYEEILTTDKITLYRYYDAETIRPNYVQQFDMGVYNFKIIITPQFFILENELYKEVKSFSKKDLATFGPFGTQLFKYVKKQRLKFKKQEDVQMLVKYYASILDKEVSNN